MADMFNPNDLIDYQYLSLMDSILKTGSIEGKEVNRTGVATIVSNKPENLTFDLSGGRIPLLQSKDVVWKLPIGELIWMLSGSSNERDLCEILYKTRDTEKKTFWTANALSESWKSSPYYKETDPYDMGEVYGRLWRYWPAQLSNRNISDHSTGGTQYTSVDQISSLINRIKEDPRNRRHVLNFWNPSISESKAQALPSCHYTTTFTVTPRRKLNALVVMRSADLFLGVPFNLVFYATLVHLITHTVPDLKPGVLHLVMSDCHIYSSHISAASRQISQLGPELLNKSNPILEIDPNFRWDYEKKTTFPLEVFKVKDYIPGEAIKAPMAV